MHGKKGEQEAPLIRRSPAGGGETQLTIRSNSCTASGSAPLPASIVMTNDPVTSGRPLRDAVPFLLSTSVTPAGRAPLRVIAAVGKPVVVIVNVFAFPTANVTVSALVMTGGRATVSVNDGLTDA